MGELPVPAVGIAFQTPEKLPGCRLTEASSFRCERVHAES